jgi:general secretion pathway protein J
VKHTHSHLNKEGFTLIEVLIALAIFAVLALISYRTLSSIFDTRERLQAESSRLRDQALFFARLESDLLAVLPRYIKTADNLPEPAMRVWAAVATPNEPRIAFTRAGFGNNSDATAAPQRIGYRLKDNTIELLIWNGLDQSPRAVPNAYPALRDVRALSIRALEPKPQLRNWRDDWPTREQNEMSISLPAALEVTVTPAVGEPIVRVFALRESSDAS